MSTKKEKKDPIETKIMHIRTAVLAAKKQSKKQLYVDILQVLDDRDTWKRRAQTLEWMLHAEGKDVDRSNPLRCQHNWTDEYDNNRYCSLSKHHMGPHR